MSKLTKIANLNASKEALEVLVAHDYEVYQLSEYHFRINRRLDIWPSSKKWYDLKTMAKGQYEDLEKFVKHFLPYGNKTI